PAAAADRACQQQCQALPHREGPAPPVEGGRPRSRDGALLCPAQFPGAPAPLAAHDLIGINSNAQIMGTAAVGVAQKEDDEQGIDQQDIFDGVVLFLPTITRRLFSRVLGADDAPFGPVMGKRGEAGTAAGMGATGAGSSSSGPTTVATSASETPSRWAGAPRERAGASPRARRAPSRPGN